LSSLPDRPGFEMVRVDGRCAGNSSRCAEPPHEPYRQSMPAARLMLFPDLGETTRQSTSTTYEHSTSLRKQHSPSRRNTYTYTTSLGLLQYNGTYMPPPETLQRAFPLCNHKTDGTGLKPIRPRLSTSTPLLNRGAPSSSLPGIRYRTIRSARKPISSIRESHSLQTLIKHVRPTGAKHQLQGGLLPLRQARQRPCRPSRSW
jgi:hypothetical protein